MPQLGTVWANSNSFNPLRFNGFGFFNISNMTVGNLMTDFCMKFLSEIDKLYVTLKGRYHDEGAEN